MTIRSGICTKRKRFGTKWKTSRQKHSTSRPCSTVRRSRTRSQASEVGKIADVVKRVQAKLAAISALSVNTGDPVFDRDMQEQQRRRRMLQ
mmetsp:Transcript_27814/g.89506  ORF Transcript_27814/g.89506 Transcript_27814/m.89506 type:complete len:91 (-) Transcript_27814:448-720(-)